MQVDKAYNRSFERQTETLNTVVGKAGVLGLISVTVKGKIIAVTCLTAPFENKCQNILIAFE